MKAKEKIREARGKDAVLRIVEKCEGVIPVGFRESSENTPTPSDIGRQIAKYDKNPYSKQAMEVPPGVLLDWVESVVRAIASEDRCLLTIGGYGYLPWLEVELTLGLEGLVTLWESIESKEMIVSNLNSTKMVCLTEEEYEYHSFLITT